MTDRIDSTARHGEVRFSRPDPAYDDAGLVFIGRVNSPYLDRADCPKNLRQARERRSRNGEPAPSVEIETRYRPALSGLSAPSWIWLVTWFDRAGRHLAVQSPRHANTPRGTFSLRSPVRPNPIGFHLVELLSLDRDRGILEIDAIDVLDATPVIDIKPFVDTIDQTREGA